MPTPLPAPLLVQSILELSNGFSEERELRYRRIKKATDCKVKALVLHQIVQTVERKTGALFPSATAPRVVIGFLSSLNQPRKAKEDRSNLIQKKTPPRPSFRAMPTRRVPIGLNAREPENWMNSLVQFLFFLPGTWDLFSLIPRSFQPIREFADQYFSDQEECLPVSLADSRELIRCLIRKLPPFLFQPKPNLYEILNQWMKAMFPDCSFNMPGELHPTVLHPEWHVVSDCYKFESAFQKKMSESPPEILVGLQGAPFLFKCHYFSPCNGVSYDLDSFIEMRPDGDGGENYIAYLKKEGRWYQCDDDRVIQFRSNCINVPLRRAFLLHYQRVQKFIK